MASKGEAENITQFKGTLDDFRTQISEAGGLVVVTFWAHWCAPCRRLSGMLPQLASENPTVKFIKIDVDEHPELAEKFSITGIPNVKLFKGVDGKGEPVKVTEIQGLDNNLLREEIKKHSK